MEESRQWAGLLDTLQDALTHALNGRVAGLNGLMQLARIRGGFDAELVALLEDEVRRLGDAAAAAAHVPRSERDLGPFTTLQEAVTAAVAVSRLRRSVALEVRPADATAVVRARPDDIVRCVLLLLHALEPAVHAGANVEVEVAEVSDATVARLRLRRLSGSAAVDAAALEEARSIAGRAGGTVTAGTPADAGTVDTEPASPTAVLELRLPRLDQED